MTYQISISGHADSKKAEAEILAKAVALAEDIGAEGAFAFHGQHFSAFASAPQEAVAAAKELLLTYAADADADDQVEAPTLKTRGDAP